MKLELELINWQQALAATTVNGAWLRFKKIVEDLTERYVPVGGGYSQHGFVPKKSCTTNLLEYLEKVTQAVDEGKAVDVVYLDFAKAFDLVPRQRLMAKLKAHGIDGELLR